MTSPSPKRTPERIAAVDAIVEKPIGLPDGTTRQLEKKDVYRWINQGLAHAKGRRTEPATEQLLEDAGEKTHDNPQPLPTIHQGRGEAGKHLKLKCKALNRCKLIARREQWQALSCDHCEGTIRGTE